MDFFVRKDSALPIDAQLNEQIKLALLVGRLRPGDTLPSIRDVAKQVNVNRGVVHKAYMELQEAGILTLKQGKGVLVEKELKYNHGGINERAESHVNDLLVKLSASGICPSAFARYLYQKAREHESKFPFVVYADITKSQALERANRISSIWQVHIEPMSLDELAHVEPNRRKQIRRVLASYLRVEQVQKLLRRTSIEVIPIGLKVKPATVEEFRKFPKGSSVLVVMDDGDHALGPFLVDLYQKQFLPAATTVKATTLGRLGNPQRVLDSGKYDRVIFASSLWEKLPEPLRKHRRATSPQLDLDLPSLESARITAGIIV
jgi:DNA-binding transcriptional regulator YhcF (GntR family)